MLTFLAAANLAVASSSWSSVALVQPAVAASIDPAMVKPKGNVLNCRLAIMDAQDFRLEISAI